MLKLGINNALRTDQNLTIGFPWNFLGSDQGTFDLAGFNQTVNALVGTKNTSNVGADSTRKVTNSAVGTNTLTVGNSNGTGIFNGVIQDGGVGKIVAITKTGTGTQTLVGDSNYSGVTTISVGTIAITHSNALGSTAGNTTIAANGNTTGGGVLSLSNNINSPENITITGATEKNSYVSAILNTSGANTLSGNITLASPTGGIRLGVTGGSLTFSGTISQTGTSQGLSFSVNSGGTITVDNPIANNGGALFIYSLGTVVLKGANGVGGIGNTVINQGGTLQLGITDALNTNANLTVGLDGSTVNTFNLASFNQTIRGLTSTGSTTRRVINSVASTTSTLTVGNGGGDYTFSGTILNNAGTGGTVALVKTGAGNQTLSGINTYTGATTVNAGTLSLGADNTIAASSSMILAGGTLDMGSYSNSVGTLTVTANSTIVLGSGTLRFADIKSVNWTGGTLYLAGALGATTLRFGDSADDLTADQLAKISINGWLGGCTLDANGYLVPPRGTLFSFF